MDHWDSYWSNSDGAVIADAELRAAMADFWQTNTAMLGDSVHALDIATGQGDAIVAINRPQWRWTATDLADVKPIDNVLTLMGVEAEKQPFASNQFDLVISQFGLEYGNTEAALAEAVRMLKQGGRFVALMHHQQSTITLQAKQEIEDIRRFEQVELTRPLLLLAETIYQLEHRRGDSNNNKQQFQYRSQQLDQCLSKLKSAVSAAFFSYLLTGVDRVLNQLAKQSLEGAKNLWLTNCDALHQFRLRNEQQLGVALSATELTQLLTAIPGEIEIQQPTIVQSRSGLIGHGVVIHT
ncbi:class I SAM-dependent methyltransferase [Ferrimonas lipolytica]|uniref:Class I SAM-dependent methyltransferase n=1 Tax=Ferrimonas lipolytica TaxID=2724191 RepID=A0A6H1UCY6_9GAMM|nr:class I SAM-dependent methyltransferase [Ferrimonas lipolytica]QIZ76945.1 class I SAM-dependent methyltransferase [Ferrimonas lipolytica]